MKIKSFKISRQIFAAGRFFGTISKLQEKKNIFSSFLWLLCVLYKEQNVIDISQILLPLTFSL